MTTHKTETIAPVTYLEKSKDLKPSADLVLVDGDIGKKETAIKAVHAAVKHFGRVDLLVNNAGIYMPKPFAEYTPEDFEAMISTNVAGYFFVTQQVVAQMRQQKSRHIVSIATYLVDQPLAGACRRRSGNCLAGMALCADSVGGGLCTHRTHITRRKQLVRVAARTLKALGVCHGLGSPKAQRLDTRRQRCESHIEQLSRAAGAN